MWVLLNHLCLMTLFLLFIGGLAAASWPDNVNEEQGHGSQRQVAVRQGFAQISDGVSYVVEQIPEPKLRRDAWAAIRGATVEAQEILTVIYSLYSEPALSYQFINTEAAIRRFDIVLGLYFSSIIKNVERQNEVIAELGKSNTDLERLKIMLSSCFFEEGQQTQIKIKAALDAQHTLIGVLVESWAWGRLICIKNDTIREEAARAVCQEPAPTKLTVAWAWNYNLAKIADPQIRQEASEAVARVSGHDKLYAAELWKDHLQAILDPEERASVWSRILLFLQQTEIRSSFDRRLKVLSMLGKGSTKTSLVRKKRKVKK